MYRLCTLADIADNDARGFRSPLGEVIVARQGLMVYGSGQSRYEFVYKCLQKSLKSIKEYAFG